MKNSTLIIAATLALLSIGTTSLAQTIQSTIKESFLESKRKEIDSLDKVLINTLGKRERVVKQIGIYKAQHNIPSLQSARFQQVLDKGIEAGEKENLSAEFITELLNAIHKESLRIEDNLKEKQ